MMESDLPNGSANPDSVLERHLQYTAIGDSLTVGYGGTQAGGFTEIFRQKLEQQLQQPILLYNYGVNGATSEQIYRYILENDEIQHRLRDSNWITLTAGGNDLLQAAKPYFMEGVTEPLKLAVRAYRHFLQDIIGLIARIKDYKSDFQLFLLDLYNPVPSMDEARIWVRRFNRPMKVFNSETIHYVPVLEAFASEYDRLISDDFVHPNDRGYQVMADVLFQTYNNVR
ncbi:hypothetical protein SY83_17475 [Paenibacillus swuensis]|uniref:SGNH hydrolase-type esterase domain-containing protein n=1 Tax=Paenibacillus swuensis TaxID=1178515 RepID=A0A172TLD0_9BACL|nr:GDSL-type esterase/lipase family protein [Paenibacillus swuensis]ANE47776.1 hypothetical protein SY83_17475 [Paenibacillus swuensis]